MSQVSLVIKSRSGIRCYFWLWKLVAWVLFESCNRSTFEDDSHCKYLNQVFSRRIKIIKERLEFWNEYIREIYEILPWKYCTTANPEGLQPLTLIPSPFSQLHHQILRHQTTCETSTSILSGMYNLGKTLGISDGSLFVPQSISIEKKKFYADIDASEWSPTNLKTIKV